MCKGPIVAPTKSMSVAIQDGFSLIRFFKRFFEKVSIRLNPPEVNMCLRCGDLQIQEVWQKIPHPQKPIISDAVKSGGITINGYLVRCDFCASVENYTKTMRENLRD